MGVSVTGIELTVLPVVVGDNREVDVPEQRDPVGVLLLPNRGLCAYTYICTQSFPMEVCVHIHISIHSYIRIRSVCAYVRMYVCAHVRNAPTPPQATPQGVGM